VPLEAVALPERRIGGQVQIVEQDQESAAQEAELLSPCGSLDLTTRGGSPAASHSSPRRRPRRLALALIPGAGCRLHPEHALPQDRLRPASPPTGVSPTRCLTAYLGGTPMLAIAPPGHCLSQPELTPELAWHTGPLQGFAWKNPVLPRGQSAPLPRCGRRQGALPANRLRQPLRGPVADLRQGGRLRR